jgi:predicted nucleic acid-binding protein
VRFLLDTCVLSELRKPRPNGGLVEWVSGTEEDRLYLSVVALMEIQKGIAKLGDDPKRASLQRWLDDDRSAVFGTSAPRG